MRIGMNNTDLIIRGLKERINATYRTEAMYEAMGDSLQTASVILRRIALRAELVNLLWQ